MIYNSLKNQFYLCSVKRYMSMVLLKVQGVEENKKAAKTWKKVLTKGERSGIVSKLSETRRSCQRESEKISTKRKKCLTNSGSSDILDELSENGGKPKGKRLETSKRSEKSA